MNDIGISLSGFSPSPPSIVEISPADIARRQLANWGAIQRLADEAIAGRST
jgi:AraC family transcriptional regulator